MKFEKNYLKKEGKKKKKIEILSWQGGLNETKIDFIIKIQTKKNG